MVYLPLLYLLVRYSLQALVWRFKRPQRGTSHAFTLRRDLRCLTIVFAISFAVALSSLPARAQQSPPNNVPAQGCFAVSDESNGHTDDSLIEVELVDLDNGLIKNPRHIVGGGSIEAIALVPDLVNPNPPASRKYQDFTIYAANAGAFGWLNFDPSTSDSPVQFVSIGSFTDDGRKASGAVSSRSLNDVDSLNYDPVNKIMYGVHRRFFEPDLLFQIDLSTGHFIPDLFQDGDDYVEVEVIHPLQDVDDIAIHPITGKLYAVINNRGEDGKLIELNPATGRIIARWDIQDTGTTVNDIEGLAFSSVNILYGSTGEHGPKGADQNQLYRITLPEPGSDAPAVAIATSVAEFEESADDVEGLGCLKSASPDVNIKVEKATNGLDADAPSLRASDVPQLALGCPVTWTYEVTNISRENIPLTNIILQDDKLGAIQCPLSTLAKDESMTCSQQEGIATVEQYKNIATVTADAVGITDAAGNTITTTATDPSHYNAFPVNIKIEKSTNGQDADEAPGPELTIGSPVSWEYVVTNMGTIGDPILVDVTVTDDMLADGDISCPKNELIPGESMACTASGTAVAGQYRNVATVAARLKVDSTGTCLVTDTDPSHYLAVGAPSITLEKLTSGCGTATPADGPQLIAEWPVLWTYRVTNNGEMPLSDISLVDDQIGSISCPFTTLAVGADMTCSAEGVAAVGAYNNLATVTASSGAGPVSAQDSSQYTGLQASLQIEKSTNGLDSDAAPGQMIPEGAPVTWTYQVTNTGEVGVKDIRVVDDQLAEADIDCGGVQTLAPGESMNCSAAGFAILGQYANWATVLAEPDVAAGASCRIDSSDPSHYEGVGDLAIGQSSSVSWSYLITNTGGITLTNVTLDGGPEVAINGCQDITLPSGASLSCGAQGPVKRFENSAIVTAIEPISNASIAITVPGSQLDGLAISALITGTTMPDATLPGSPTLLVDSDVSWEYVVTNQGGLPIEGIVAETVTLNTGSRQPLACPKTTLAVGESMSCLSTSRATEGLTGVIGTATGRFNGTARPVYADAAGFYTGTALATVGGRLFIDELNTFGSANGRQERADPPLLTQNVKIDLYTAGNGQLIQTSNADSAGNYAFQGLWPGEYYMVVHRPSLPVSALQEAAFQGSAFQGFIWAKPNQSNNRLDSDAVPIDGNPDLAKTETFRLRSGDVDLTWDIGFEQLIFAGRVFIDANSNRMFDAGETIVNGATVTIIDQLNPGGQAAERISDSQGSYAFDAVAPSLYDVTAVHSDYRLESVGSPESTTANFVATPKLASGIYLPIITNPTVGGGK